MGSLYAGHLLRKNGRLAVYDIDPKRVRVLEQEGADASASAAELAAACDFIVLSLPDPAAVESTLTGPGALLAHARPGALIIDLSTIDPDSSRQLSAAAGNRRVSYLDAPVSSGEPGGSGTAAARGATLTFMVGGEREAFERATPVFRMLGKRYLYLGPSGAGSTAKIISNHIAGLTNLVVAEAFVLGAAAGVGAETLFEIFDGTDAKSYWLFEYFRPRVRERDFEPGFTVALQHKDHLLAHKLGERLGVSLLLNHVALYIYESMKVRGLGDRDLVAAIKFLGDLAHVDVLETGAADAAQPATTESGP